ncbi:collagen adhesin [Paucilactobacillus oligofermentans DSM 15707 = LMG 22743]|uniref:Collagen adhesin n=1 Tax=Paucilactobacillus oligofermentans DSM 15707 = LMG 22743 TaxID=1423778 RepID=A0A0R1RMV0_9LACO|nr:Cna B-type domain-containing protein [Paucilactobacillus oligofermentans]KRL58172.1 collagen adhesin [Paucilactobacillus oligofermentans DSM 15707 = LMG 22743]CUS26880.1 Collagen-binding surface protein [Paucilactobacillus oligofermentans DSM 15707 = LMG 22743]
MYKKIWAYLTVLLMLGSVLGYPLTTMADTSNSKTVTSLAKQSTSSVSTNQALISSTSAKVFETPAASTTKVTKAASQDWQDQFITKAELQDEDGNVKTDFGIYDSMQAVWNFTIPAGEAKAGDTMTVDIPSVFTLANVTKFDITDAGGTVIGHAIADPATGKVTITLTDAVKDNHNAITGSFKLVVHWNTNEVEQDTKVPIDWGNAGSIEVNVNPSDGPDKGELLYKWGWYDADNPNVIHWRVRVNYANKTINNAVYTDIVGGDQTLVSGSVVAQNVKYQAGGNDFTVLSTYPSSATIEDGTAGFKTNLGDITGTVLIDYETNITNNGASVHYENSGNLTGYNIEKQTVDVYSPDNSGNGNAATTVSVNGTKTWDDQNNQDGTRPNSITVNLLANGKLVQSKKVSAADNWQYSFSELPEYDSNGQKVIYTVTENQTKGYTTAIDGNNLINHYTPGITSVTVTKSWNDQNNQDGIRPDKIRVQLYANGQKQGDEVILTSEANWTHTWQNLKDKQNGQKVKYTVKEVGTVSGYKSSVNDKNQGNIMITNSHTSKTPSETVTPGKPTPNSSVNLPQTSEQQSMWLIALGILILVAAIGGVIIIKRRQDK